MRFTRHCGHQLAVMLFSAEPVVVIVLLLKLVLIATNRTSFMIRFVPFNKRYSSSLSSLIYLNESAERMYSHPVSRNLFSTF